MSAQSHRTKPIAKDIQDLPKSPPSFCLHTKSKARNVAAAAVIVIINSDETRLFSISEK